MDSDDNTTAISINSVLPDGILEEILSKLSLASITRARVVCKSWYYLLRSASFLLKLSASPPSSRKSWYFSLRCGRAYDLALDSWLNLKFPPSAKPYLPAYTEVASSLGLICSMICESKLLKFYVYNPITRLLRKLPDPPNLPRCRRSCRYRIALTMSAGRVSGTYIIAVITADLTFRNAECGDQIRTHVYSSEKMVWETRADMFLPIQCDTRSFVICDEVLYFRCLSYATHGIFLCANDLFSGSGLDILPFEENLILMPCSVDYSLINMKGKVVLVGLSMEEEMQLKVWLLDGKEWVEVSIISHEYITFLKYAYLRVSRFDEIIYIYDEESKTLAIFEMSTCRWRLVDDLPLIGDGIYFEPRLEVIP